MSVATDLVQRLIELDEKIKSQTAELKELSEEREEIERLIVDEWSSINKQNENRQGKTIYQARELHCSTAKGHSDQLQDALRSEGLDEFIREQVSMQSLKSWVRENSEVDDSGERDLSQVPEQVRACLNLYEKHTIRIRKA
jgi:seryl-tRNA synthetase